MNRHRLEDRVAGWVSDHPLHTSTAIALAVQSRREAVEEVLKSPLFSSSQIGRSRLWVLSGATGQDGTGRKAPTHKQRVLALLSDRKPHTHLEIYNLRVVAHSRISDLRHDGHTIHQWREGDLYLYQLADSDSALAVEGPASVESDPAFGKPSFPRSVAGSVSSAGGLGPRELERSSTGPAPGDAPPVTSAEHAAGSPAEQLQLIPPAPRGAYVA